MYRRQVVRGAVVLLALAAVTGCGQSSSRGEGPSINEQIAGPRPTAMSTNAQTYFGGAWVEVQSFRPCSGADSGNTDIQRAFEMPHCLVVLASQQGGCEKGFQVTATFEDSYGSVIDRVTSRRRDLPEGQTRWVAVPTRRADATDAEVVNASCI